MANNEKTQVLTNELSLKFVDDKIKELCNTDKINAIRNIDHFIEDESFKIIENDLITKLKHRRDSILSELIKERNDQNAIITRISNENAEYKKDIEAIESLKKFKRQSKIFNWYKSCNAVLSFLLLHYTDLYNTKDKTLLKSPLNDILL